MAARGFVSYWILPVFSSLVWLGMLLGLLLYWVVDTNSVHYSYMDANDSIAFISDVGASNLKPLFIAGSSVTTVFLDLSFAAERLLRHNGRLVPNTTVKEKVLSILSIIFAIVGTAGLILLSIFDTNHHHKAHDIFLLLFIAGYIISAIFICWEYQQLGLYNRQHRVLRISFWVKLTFVLVEFVLAVVFVATNWSDNQNVAAVFEWIIAFIFTFYILSFVIDLLPAIRTKPHSARFPKLHEHDIESTNSHDGINAQQMAQTGTYQNDYDRGVTRYDFR
ncbi:fk506 suppressor sfk1 [Trichoderma arundinaceum]|uniref:Fk506 suppressor sfk1 n=1 Tax=Trichoderma arundinaceum TaxID=490622 RepID=A0A395NUJ4_TRIAR|nr:fk506 suppressor sfk1 [Trichoderma arundinaceum]